MSIGEEDNDSDVQIISSKSSNLSKTISPIPWPSDQYFPFRDDQFPKTFPRTKSRRKRNQKLNNNNNPKSTHEEIPPDRFYGSNPKKSTKAPKNPHWTSQFINKPFNGKKYSKNKQKRINNHKLNQRQNSLQKLPKMQQKEAYLKMIDLTPETKEKHNLVVKHFPHFNHLFPEPINLNSTFKNKEVIVISDDNDDETDTDMKDSDIEVLPTPKRLLEIDRNNRIQQLYDEYVKKELYETFMEVESIEEHYNHLATPRNYVTDKIVSNFIRRKREREKQKKLKLKAEQIKKEKQMKNIIDSSKLRKLKLIQMDLAIEFDELDENKIISSHASGITARKHDLSTLLPGNWLNDEVINFYMTLLQDRNLNRLKSNKIAMQNKVKCLFLNTFFFTKLDISSNCYRYNNVKRWTKKLKLKNKGIDYVNNIFELDRVFIPVHVNDVHWCCGCLNFRDKRIEYYDSMNGSHQKFFIAMKKYLQDEYKDKVKDKSVVFEINEWKCYAAGLDCPQQDNTCDCGVFTCKVCDWLSDEMELDFTQENIPYFRRRIMQEIIQGQLLDNDL